jgi:hypothetical protein
MRSTTAYSSSERCGPRATAVELALNKQAQKTSGDKEPRKKKIQYLIGTVEAGRGREANERNENLAQKESARQRGAVDTRRER